MHNIVEDLDPETASYVLVRVQMICDISDRDELYLQDLVNSIEKLSEDNAGAVFSVLRKAEYIEMVGGIAEEESHFEANQVIFVSLTDKGESADAEEIEEAVMNILSQITKSPSYNKSELESNEGGADFSLTRTKIVVLLLGLLFAIGYAVFVAT